MTILPTDTAVLKFTKGELRFDIHFGPWKVRQVTHFFIDFRIK